MTGEVYDTAKLVGDLGLILKDIGAPTVVGMLCLRDALQVFEEAVSPYRPTTPPMGHACAEAVLAMKALIAWDFDRKRVAAALIGLMNSKRVDPELAHVAINTLARKAEQVRRGPVTNLIIRATDPVSNRVLLDRATKSYEWLKAGRSLEDVVQSLELERKVRVETGAGAYVTRMLGKEVSFNVRKIAPRHHKKGMRGNWWVFDMDVDLDVTVAGKMTQLNGLAHNCIPQAVLEKNAEMAAVVGLACFPVAEFALSPHSIVNITVPAALAVVMGLAEPVDAAKTAEKAAYITAAIPGIKDKAQEVAERATEILAELE
jgi:hypothetical protein